MRIRTRLALICLFQLLLLWGLWLMLQRVEQAQQQVLAAQASPAAPTVQLALAAEAAGSAGTRPEDWLQAEPPGAGPKPVGLAEAQTELRDTKAWVQGLLLAAACALLWMLLSLDHVIQQPVKHLKRWAQQMHGGDMNSRTALKGSNEFSELSSTLDRMACAMADNVHNLQAEVQRRQAAEAALSQLAFHDALTGLPSLRLLRDRLASALARARRSHQGLTVIFVDLDDFKPVNDLHGHEVGNVLLREVARRLSAALRDEDTVARIGGDEFVLLLPELRSADAAQALRRKLQMAIARPVVVPGVAQPIRVQASMGIAQCPQDGLDGETLLRMADQDMYRNKSMRKLLDRLGGEAGRPRCS